MTNEERARQIANGYGTYNDKCATGGSGIAYHSAMAMAEWKDQQLADYLQQEWDRYAGACSSIVSAHRCEVERMANDLGIKLKFNNPYIE